MKMMSLAVKAAAVSIDLNQAAYAHGGAQIAKNVGASTAIVTMTSHGTSGLANSQLTQSF